MDPIKAVAEEIYEQYKFQQDIRENDILFVNDGTFLIGRTAIITKFDIKMIIQSHLKKIRILDTTKLDPFYFLYLLNSKIVRKQIDAKTFVQATISTLGNRLNELILPISTDTDRVKQISDEVREIIDGKTRLRQRTMQIIGDEI